MTTAHTATPWMLGRGSLIEIFARNPDSYDDVNSTDSLHVASVQRRDGKSVAQSHADAEFIVRACNAHDDFVKAAIAVLELEHGPYMGPKDKAPFELLRAALAKAGAA